MITGLIVTAASTSPPVRIVTGLHLWIPAAVGGGFAFLVVVVAGVIAWQMSNGMPFKWWINGSVYGGPSWTATDSWVTNIGAVGGVLGTVITNSSAFTTTNAATNTTTTVISSDVLAGITLLFLVFGGAAVVAPVIYGATAKVESEGITNTTGRVWGFLLAGAASVTAFIGEMATVGLLLWAIPISSNIRWTITIAIVVGALAVGAYSVRSLIYFATVPAPRPGKGTGASLAVRRSLLGNGSFSATL